jgi:hypothetical protein
MIGTPNLVAAGVSPTSYDLILSGLLQVFPQVNVEVEIGWMRVYALLCLDRVLGRRQHPD